MAHTDIYIYRYIYYMVCSSNCCEISIDVSWLSPVQLALCNSFEYPYLLIVMMAMVMQMNQGRFDSVGNAADHGAVMLSQQSAMVVVVRI